MRLAELLGGARFPVACGLAPSIGHLDAEVDNHTLAEPEPDELNVGLAKPESARQSLGSSPEVRAVISELWDVFVKSEDCSVSPEQYKGFVRRIVRVLLPGLKADQEETVAANTWQEDARGLDRLTFAPFFEAVIRFSSNWTDSDDPTAIAAFIKDLLLRITKVEVTVTATGQAVQKDNVVQVAFRGAKAGVASDRRPSDPALTRLLDVRQKGTLPKFQLSLALGSGASGPQPDLCCWWEERRRSTRRSTPAPPTERGAPGPRSTR
ncbi:unnamed protein product [Prorocentrum cordatum]|uniref:tRNA exportin n=1 Tax=Prorocentrum cordatum TaxID=2364126 RepID=A0ABN9UU16_9DINO|nr:unnamed protein product [Polarella glacialis]